MENECTPIIVLIGAMILCLSVSLITYEKGRVNGALGVQNNKIRVVEELDQYGKVRVYKIEEIK
jgi:hypothetical protein